MYNRLRFFLAVMLITIPTAAFAQTTVDVVTGRVVRVDPGTQVIVLDNNQSFRVTPQTVLMVDNRPVTLGTVQPGQTVIIRSAEAIAITQSAPVTAQAPGSAVVVTSPSASPGLAQTVYGRVTDVNSGEVKIKTDTDNFKVKMPRELAAQVRKGDSVRLDLTFQMSR